MFEVVTMIFYTKFHSLNPILKGLSIHFFRYFFIVSWLKPPAMTFHPNKSPAAVWDNRKAKNHKGQGQGSTGDAALLWCFVGQDNRKPLKFCEGCIVEMQFDGMGPTAWSFRSYISNQRFQAIRSIIIAIYCVSSWHLMNKYRPSGHEEYAKQTFWFENIYFLKACDKLQLAVFLLPVPTPTLFDLSVVHIGFITGHHVTQSPCSQFEFRQIIFAKLNARFLMLFGQKMRYPSRTKLFHV